MSARELDARPPERIALFRALYLGDLLVSVPALRAIRARFPQAEITLIGLPWAAEFAGRYRCYIDRFVEFQGYPGIPEGFVDEAHAERFLAEQRAYGYDLAVQMHGSGKTSNGFVLGLKARVTAGYYDGVKPAALTIGAPYPTDQHEIMRNLGLAAMLGCTELSPCLEFPLFAEDDREAVALLGGGTASARPPNGLQSDGGQAEAAPPGLSTGSLLLGIHPGSRSPARRWPVEYFATVADALVERFGASIVLTGSSGEMETVEAVAAHMKAPAYNLAGRTSLGSLAALIDRFSLFISNDTGPAHIACAVRCPSITIFGPAEYERWAALDQTLHPAVRRSVECSPCGYRECPIDHRCLRWLAPKLVTNVAERLLYETAQNPDLAYSRQLSEYPGAH